MRKADYQALAYVVNNKRAEMARVQQHATDEQTRLVALAIGQCARDIAEDFARVASVDRAAFLKACGIDT